MEGGCKWRGHVGSCRSLLETTEIVYIKERTNSFICHNNNFPPTHLGFMLAKIKHQKEWHFHSHPVNIQYVNGIIWQKEAKSCGGKKKKKDFPSLYTSL